MHGLLARNLLSSQLLTRLFASTLPSACRPSSSKEVFADKLDMTYTRGPLIVPWLCMLGVLEGLPTTPQATSCLIKSGRLSSNKKN